MRRAAQVGRHGRPGRTVRALAELSRRGTLRSPFLAAPLWTALVLVLYPLGWSRLQGPLRSDTVLLLAATVVVFGLLSFLVPTPVVGQDVRPLRLAPTVAVTAYFMAAYLHNGGIPVVQIALGRPYDLYGFGIPRLHVLMLTLTGYLAVRAFRVLLEHRSVFAFITFGWLLMLLGSIANRSAVSFVAVACVVLVVRSRRVGWRWLSALAVVMALGAYLFGVAGNLRLGYQLEQLTGQPAQGDEILRVAGASQGFIDSGVSPAFLWSYLYVVSPSANLNSALAFNGGAMCGHHCNLTSLGAFELLPDVISLKVAALAGLAPFDKSVFIVSPSLTASTTYGSAIGYAGLVGACVIVLFLAVIAAVVVFLLRGSRTREEGLALLATMLFFGFFENMWSYSALSLQLAFPIALAVLPERWTHLPGPWRSAVDNALARRAPWARSRPRLTRAVRRPVRRNPDAADRWERG